MPYWNLDIARDKRAVLLNLLYISSKRVSPSTYVLLKALTEPGWDREVARFLFLYPLVMCIFTPLRNWKSVRRGIFFKGARCIGFWFGRSIFCVEAVTGWWSYFDWMPRYTLYFVRQFHQGLFRTSISSFFSCGRISHSPSYCNATQL